MISAVDRALVALLRRDVLGEAVDVSIEAPNRAWTAALTKPTVNLFLFDVRENLSRREVMVEPVRDATGTVVARRPPPTRYDLFYVVSAWGCPVELEHQLLAAVVASLGSYNVIPPELMGDEATPQGVFLTTTPGMKRGMLPMFSGELKIQLDVSVTVPLVLPTATVAGPPVREPARLTVLDRSPEEIAEVRRRGIQLPAARTADGDPFAVTRTELAAAVEAMPPTKPAGPPQGGPGGPPGQRPAGPPGQRPAGPPAQRPPGAPAGAPPGAAGQRTPGAGGPPPNPLAILKVALAQAAQAQAALAQAVTAVAQLVPAAAPTAAAAPSGAPTPAATPAPAAAPTAPAAAPAAPSAESAPAAAPPKRAPRTKPPAPDAD